MEPSKYSLAISHYGRNAVQMFEEEEAESLVSALEREVRAVELNASDPKGRAAISSLSHKVSRSKTALDGFGKDLVSAQKEKCKKIDSQRKLIRDRLDVLRDEVRSPLIKWQAEEKEKAAILKLALEVESAFDEAISENDLFDRQKELLRREELLKQAEIKKENERLAEQEARQQKEQEEREEKERKEREEKIREDAIQAEREASLRKEKAAEERVIAARVAQENAESEKRAALKKAEERRLKDIEDTKNRLQKEQEEKKIEAEIQKEREIARAAVKALNKKHQLKLNKESEADLSNIVDKSLAVLLVEKIAKNEIRNITINY